MPRVTDEELREIVETRPDEVVTPFINDAALLVDETLGILPNMTEARLTLLEKYLAAHLWVLAKEKGGLTSEKKGESAASYVTPKGKGLSSTRFGGLVRNLDTTGLLEKVLSGEVKKAQLRVV